MNAEIDRLKHDLKTIEQAVGCEPEFGPRHVKASLGWGVSGLALVLAGCFPRALPSPWGLVPFLVLFLGSCYFMITRSSAASARDLNSGSLNGLGLVLMVGVLFWLSKLAVPIPYGVANGIICLIAGVWMMLLAWGKPWRRGLYAWTVALLAVGFASPFLPKGGEGVAMGAGIAFAGFAGAAILHFQLQAYYAHGKAAH